MIGPDEYKKRNDDVAELMKKKTHTIKNFRVQPNDDKFKLTDHRFKLNFISGTKVDPNEIPNVSVSGFKFKKFEKIKALNFCEDLLVGKSNVFHHLLTIFYTSAIKLFHSSQSIRCHWCYS
jgi:hypothetical protein